MFKPLLLAAMSGACLYPALARADEACPQRSQNRTIGTVVGAGLGALLGNSVASGGGKTGGTVIGAVAGGVAGNAVGASSTHCGGNLYGWYDGSGAFHPNTATEYGYYGPDGRWVEYRPNEAAVAASMTRTPAAQPAPAYAAAPNVRSPVYRAAPLRADATWGDRWDGASNEFSPREDWLDRRVRGAMADGVIDRYRGDRLLRDLDQTRRDEAYFRQTDGRLRPRERADINGRLDDIGDRLKALLRAGGEVGAD